MENSKKALLQELRDRTPKSGEFWKEAKDLVPGMHLAFFSAAHSQ